jgi:hypothetical protein
MKFKVGDIIYYNDGSNADIGTIDYLGKDGGAELYLWYQEKETEKYGEKYHSQSHGPYALKNHVHKAVDRKLEVFTMIFDWQAFQKKYLSFYYDI